MNLSRERLLAQAASTGFRPEVLEKVLRLVSLLNALSSSPLADRIRTRPALMWEVQDVREYKGLV